MSTHPEAQANPHPLCPSCDTNAEVARRVRIETEEYQWLDADGEVIDALDTELHQEVGWAWHCLECGEEWGQAGTLAIGETS